MEIKELLTFKCIVENGTFSKAAEILHYTQPTITNHIKQLESTLNFKLFVRGWDAKLTTQGQIFYDKLDDLLEHWHYVENVAYEISNEERGTLKIGILEIYSEYIIQKIINWLRVNKPKINAEFILGNTEFLYDLVDNKKIDMAFSTKRNVNVIEIDFIKIREEESGFVIDKNHPLAKKSSISIKSILKYPIIVGDKTCITNKKFNDFLLEKNLKKLINSLYVCSNQLLITSLIKNDMIGILPRAMILKETQMFIELKEFNINFEYGIITRKKSKPYLSVTISKIIDLFI